MIQIGDKVKVVRDVALWLTDYGLGSDTLLTVVGPNPDNIDYIDPDRCELEIEAINQYPKDFEKVEQATPITTLVSETIARATADEVLTTRLPLSAELALPVFKSEPFTGEELGVYRPNLEDRKVGKVRVELVDDGFPLALREVAKVMTWAQTAKGYKDHDWQNLPNPEQALAAAASRHRSDYIIQRMVEQLAPTDCVDIESSIIHKAHEAFGVLAQLELILRGKIK